MPSEGTSHQDSQRSDLTSVSIAELLRHLGITANGLSAAEAGERLARQGPNENPEKTANPILKFLSYFWGPIPWMIEVAAVLLAVVHHWGRFWNYPARKCGGGLLGRVQELGSWAGSRGGLKLLSKSWWLWIVVTELLVRAAATQPLDCAQCHDQPHMIVGTAHSSIACLTCHPHHNQFPHPAGIPKPACAGCHPDVAAQNRIGVHGVARARGNQAAPDCGVCHGNVHQVQRTGTEAFRKSIPSICGTCHDRVYTQYEDSAHGKAAAAGIVAAPVCSTCHGEHQIQPPTVATSPVNPVHIPETCGRCHGDVALARKFDLPTDIVVSYNASFHGLALKAGQQTVANCATCHGVHEILPASDSRSSINPKNLPHTCGKCHPGAGTRFAIGQIHWAGLSEPPAMRWVRGFYLALIPLLVGLMALHNLGDWTRKILRTRLRGRPEGARRRQVERVTVAAIRMFRFERIEHGLLVVSFVVLVWSGFALKYSDQWWAAPLLAWESGWAVRGTVHRIAAVVLVGLAVTHVFSLFVNRKLRAHWKSLLPKVSDIREGKAVFAYNMGFGSRRPVVAPHSYIEKVEYSGGVVGCGGDGANRNHALGPCVYPGVVALHCSKRGRVDSLLRSGPR